MVLDVLYHTQRNNKLFPYATCGTTSVAMIMSYIDHKYGKDYVKDDDGVFKELNTDEIKNRLKEHVEETPENDDWLLQYIDPSRPGGYTRMNNLSICLAFVIDKITNNQYRGTLSYKSKQSIEDYLVTKKMPLIIPGKFTVSGHYVLIIGINFQTGNFIYHDPYGDWRTGYKETDGCAIEYDDKELVSKNVYQAGYNLTSTGKIRCITAEKV